MDARVIVIGGGVVGCSVLYHLAKAGWTDALLLERKELTAGSTWHAAGGVHTLNGDPNVAKLQQYTQKVFAEIQELSDQSIGLHMTGGVSLAGTKERLDWLKMSHARGRYLGMETEIISPEEAREIFPLLDPKHFVGAMWDPAQGHLDPSQTTHAYAKAARKLGARIQRHTKVEDLSPRPDGTWEVITDAGSLRAEHVVNAGGLWAREIGRMVGLELPVLAMEHMYLLTEDMPEVAEFNDRAGKLVPHAVDFEGELYLRQERGGMLMGTYERACVPWSPKETPWDFDTELLAPDLDRLAPSLEVGFSHFPAFENAGIKTIINGPFTFAPDGNPLVGPVRGLKNFWCACAVMAGFSQGGGVGLALANWITEGDPGFDVWAMDVARYGDWATLGYTNAKVRENYARRFSITFPNEELPAGRPLLTTPLYDRLKAEGAVFGQAYGLEHALWFARPGKDAQEDQVSFERSNDFDAIGEECAAVREKAGVIEIANFANYEVTGEGARAWLDWLLAGRLPKVGRMALTPMLNERGKLIGDFTVGALAEDRFLITGAGGARAYHMRWFAERLPERGGVAIEDVSMAMTGLQIAGPESRAILAELTDLDLSRFSFMAIAEADVAMSPAIVGRVSFTGSLGYEIWVAPEALLSLDSALFEAGRARGLRRFGGRAFNALRLEKNWGTWAREYRPIHTPFEAGLDRFVDLQKPDFVGRAAAVEARDAGPERKLAAFAIDALTADPIGDEPIFKDGAVVGWVTSGGYAHASKTSVAMGYVEASAHDPAASYEIELLGSMRPAKILEQPLYDPTAAAMRG